MEKDPLINKIDQILNKTKAAVNNQKKAWDQSTAGKLHKDFTLVQRFLFQVIQVAAWLWKWIGSPIRKFLEKAFSQVFFWYIDLWNAVVFKNGSFSIIRGVLMGVGSVALLYALILLGHLSGIAILILSSLILRLLKNQSIAIRSTFMALSFITVMFSEFIFDALILYPLTSKVHVVYTKGIHEIDTDHDSGTHDVFSTGGCDDKESCSSDDTDTYRIRPLAFNTVYSMIMHRSLFYPDYISRAIPQETGKCLMHTWGWRQKFIGRGIYRSWDMYADILSARCVGIDKDL